MSQNDKRTSFKQNHLTIAEKYWIVLHAENNKAMSASRLGSDFTAEFGRPIHRGTISRILKKKDEILDIVTNGRDLDTNKVKKCYTGVLQFQSDLAEKVTQISTTTNITYEIISLAGKDIQNQPKYAEDKSVQKIKFSNTFINNFLQRHGFRSGSTASDTPEPIPSPVQEPLQLLY